MFTSILFFFYPRRYRYAAYRQFVRWCFGVLGRHVRVALPACAVKKIRAAFPAAQYAGFQYPNLDDEIPT